jgi:hypothetical protein
VVVVVVVVGSVVVEQGAVPEGVAPLDLHIAQRLARLTSSKQLLPEMEWERISGEYELEGAHLDPLENAWRPIGLLFKVAGDSSQPHHAEANLCGAVFVAYMAALVDSLLLCTFLSARCRKQGKQPPKLVPVVGGTYALQEVVPGRHLRLMCVDDAILGLQCKSGCVGRQLRKSVAAQKQELAAQLAAESQSGVAGVAYDSDSDERQMQEEEFKEEISRSYKQLPSTICTALGKKEDTCNEAVVLSAALRVFEEAASPIVKAADISSTSAEATLFELATESEVGLAACALCTLLFLSKYWADGPMYGTPMAALYTAYNYKTSMYVWHEERCNAHLLGLAAYFDCMPFGSTEHDGILTLQNALGFDVQSGSGTAMPMISFNLGQARCVAAVFSRLLRLLPPKCTLHLDCCLDYYEVLVALGLGLLPYEPTSAHGLHQLWLAGVFPAERVGVVQLLRTSQGNQKAKSDAVNSSRWVCQATPIL